MPEAKNPTAASNQPNTSNAQTPQGTKENGAKGHTPEPTTRAEAQPTGKSTTPFTFLRRLGEDMERLFEEFGLDAGLRAPRLVTRGSELLKRESGIVSADWSPKVDVLERDGVFHIRADLPGLTKDQITLEVGDHALMIQGERRQRKEEEHAGWYVSECNYGHFHRVIPLPEGVDTSKAKAHFSDGVLEVEIPAPQRAAERTRRIEVRS